MFSWVNMQYAGSDENDLAILFPGISDDVCFYLYNFEEPLTGFFTEEFAFSNISVAAPSKYTISADVIDAAQNLYKDVFISEKLIWARRSCWTGMVIAAY